MMKLSTHQWRFLRRCANHAQRSTAEKQNTIRSLIGRGLIHRFHGEGLTYVGLTSEGATVLARAWDEAKSANASKSAALQAIASDDNLARELL